nr:hypothetical protein [Tanacetum cinerariifolium]
MATLVISISSDSSEDNMGTPVGRVILFGTIPTTIPDTTPMITPPTADTPIITPTIPPSLDYSPASEAESDPSEDLASGHIPPLPAASPFLSSDDDTTDNHSSPDLPSTSAGPSRKRHRSPMTSVPVLPLVSRALSLVRADLIPPPKRLKDIGYLADVEEGAAEVTYETLGDLVQRFHDHTQAIPVHRIQTTEGIQGEQGRRIVEVESAVIALTERVAELERDNHRLRGTVSVESQRVDQLQCGMSRM